MEADIRDLAHPAKPHVGRKESINSRENRVQSCAENQQPIVSSHSVCCCKKTTGVPITTSEMRYIYRHWSELKNKVLWYLNYQKLEFAPWEVSSTSMPDCLGGSVTLGSEMWASYSEHLLSKADRKDPSNLRD